jgi:hypothetical protein
MFLRFENQKTEKGTYYYRAKAEYTPGNGDSESGDVEAIALPFRHGHLGVPTAVPEKLLWSCSLNLHHHWHLDYYKAEAEC